MATITAEALGDTFLKVDFADLKEGVCKRMVWDEKPILICRRTSQQISRLLEPREMLPAAANDSGLIKSLEGAQLAYGRSFANELLAMHSALPNSGLRSLRDDVFVVIPSDPYTGCAILTRADKRQRSTVVPMEGVGGFYNPCGGESYDLAGRIVAGHQHGNDWNLHVPPYRHDDADTLTLGMLPDGVRVPDFDFSPNLYDPRLSAVARLLLATEWGSEALVRRLVNNGLSVNVTNEFNVTPLMVASGRGNSSLVQFFIERGADPDAANAKGVTPLSSALMVGNEHIVSLLLQANASVVRRCHQSECPPPYLIQVLETNPDKAERVALVRLLLEYGANPHEVYAGKTVLEAAEALADADMVHLIQLYATDQ
ncbi:MAG: ankyrin repeat domain-containing protein [Pseudomonadota bacterium]